MADAICPNCGLAPHGPCTGWRPSDDPPLTPEQERIADEHFDAMNAEPELEDVIAHTQYAWDCPRCGEVNTVDHDPAGEVLGCEECDERVRVAETR